MLERLAKVLAIAAVIAGLASTTASAQAYPTKSVRMLIAFPPGGSIDTLGRILAQKLAEAWGQNVVVENRPGAGGNLGAAAAAQAGPDGYTLHLGAQTLGGECHHRAVSEPRSRPGFRADHPGGGGADVLMVRAEFALPFAGGPDRLRQGASRRAQLRLARRRHQRASVLRVLFTQVTGSSCSTCPIRPASAGHHRHHDRGRIAIWLATLGGALGNVQAGKMRALAMSGPARSQALPDVPTFKEQGIAMEEESTWFALLRAERHAEGCHRQGQRRCRAHPTLPDVSRRAA